MPDLIVLGMEMPSGCETCPLKELHASPVAYNIRCPIVDKWVSGCEAALVRPPHCPLRLPPGCIRFDMPEVR